MFDKLRLDHILFLDIETVPETEKFDSLDEEMQQLFEAKTAYLRKDGEEVSQFYNRAGIWAEFGRIICISVGYFVFKKGDRQFRTTSFYGDEKVLLFDFGNLLNTHFNQPYHVLCGHNAKEFDFPFIARRMLIHGMSLPEKLKLSGKKPWEIAHLDTMEMWKFGDYKHFTSLRLLTKVLKIPSSKDDIDGSQVAHVFYEEKDIDRIIVYCEKDVVAVAQVVLRFKREPLLDLEEILSI